MYIYPFLRTFVFFSERGARKNGLFRTRIASKILNIFGTLRAENSTCCSCGKAVSVSGEILCFPSSSHDILRNNIHIVSGIEVSEEVVLVCSRRTGSRNDNQIGNESRNTGKIYHNGNTSYRSVKTSGKSSRARITVIVIIKFYFFFNEKSATEPFLS